MYFKGVYKNCYDGAEKEIGLIADDIKQAEQYMSENISDYIWECQNMCYEEYLRKLNRKKCLETDDSWNDFYNSQEYEDYVASCSYDVYSCTSADCYSWNDLRD